MYLVKYSSNWADEIDIDGHVVLSDGEYDIFMMQLNALENGFTFCIGTNQEIDYESSSDVLDNLEVIAINDADFVVLNNLGLLSQGFAEDLVSTVNDEFFNGGF